MDKFRAWLFGGNMAIAMVVNAQRYDWQTWLMGIFRSIIQGGAAAVVSGPAAMIIAPTAFNLGDQLWHTVAMMMTMFIGQGIFHMFFFLQTHPCPELITTKFTETDTTRVGMDGESKVTSHVSTVETTTVKPVASPSPVVIIPDKPDKPDKPVA